ncbi:MAG: TolC family protein [Microscillaceae bacterium]|nr:TolC family protein [Microscillaceae bacterium]
MRSLVFIQILLFLWIGSTKAQESTEILEAYIQEALANHEGIRQQNYTLEKSQAATEEARRLFMPQSVFKFDYTLAGGGRTIDFPVGDLLNPAYQALNQLTDSDRFPQLSNQSILLNPNNFYDAKVRTSAPLYNAEIKYNYRIKKQQSSGQTIELQKIKRELVKQVKAAYYQYQQAEIAVKIYEKSLLLTAENKRISEKLLANGRGNRTAVARAETELIILSSDLEKARNTALNARSYFNFLLNKPLESPILILEQPQEDFPALTENTTSKREELAQITLADSISRNVLRLNQVYRQPKLNAFVDLGTQGFDAELNSKTFYYLAGISLEVNLFTFGRNQQKIKQNEADLKIIASQKAQIEDQLNLQLDLAQNDYRSALIQYQAAKSREEIAQKVYQDTQELYKEGLAIFIELLDAQNQYLNAQNQRNIARTEVWLKWVEIERVNASYDL